MGVHALITINTDKARDIAHAKRREKRAEEFKLYDEVIMKQIPGKDATEAEKKRAEIRLKYAGIQASIDTASGIDELKAIVEKM